MLDFDTEWNLYQERRVAPVDSAQWSKRSARYDSTDARNLYAEDFIALSNMQPGETVFDMGCGTGTIAAPLAANGHGVIAADFSDGMLHKLHENMTARGIAVVDVAAAAVGGKGCVAPILMSWEDDWSSFGLTDNMVDVAIASRSISVYNLREALAKLCAIARRRCCITMTTGASPRVDPSVLAAIDAPAELGRDFVYAFGMLAQGGFEPEVRYIHSKRKDTFESFEAALNDFANMIDIGCPNIEADERAAAVERLAAWLESHVVENPDAGKPDKKGIPQGALMLDYERTVPWAFISWNPTLGAL